MRRVGGWSLSRGTHAGIYGPKKLQANLCHLGHENLSNVLQNKWLPNRQLLLIRVT